MLTYDDSATIRHAIIKRLTKEPGLAVADLKIIRQPNSIAVGIWIILKDRMTYAGVVDIRAFFDLPEEFHLLQLHNEIDEIAEACKEARSKAGLSVIWNPERNGSREPLKGTGLRGRWIHG